MTLTFHNNYVCVRWVIKKYIDLHSAGVKLIPATADLCTEVLPRGESM